VYRWLRIVRLGFGSLLLHPLRSSLTVLGIFCGVASVIVMLAFGEGTSFVAQQRIRALGSTNVILRSRKPPESQSARAERSRLSEYGLTYLDVERLRATFPDAEILVPIREIVEDVQYLDRRTTGRVVGTVPWFVDIANLRVASGRFLTEVEMTTRANTCVLGPSIAADLFPYGEPVGRTLRIKGNYYRIVGVMEASGPRKIGDTDVAGGANAVYIPVTTAKDWFGETLVRVSSGSRDMERVELHEVDVRLPTPEEVPAAKEAAEELMGFVHPKGDVQVLAPLDLLRAAERTKRDFNLLLGSVAAVSLLVGGIGIMNIMLATVTERTREIGIRRALGARRRHITMQFLVECVVLAASGGFLGVVVGVGVPFAYEALSDRVMIVTPWSVLLSFTISVVVGIAFGLYPAVRAARLDPIVALRHE
jgi:putative ABC transport system permease protein